MYAQTILSAHPPLPVAKCLEWGGSLVQSATSSTLVPEDLACDCMLPNEVLLSAFQIASLARALKKALGMGGARVGT